MAHQGSTIIPSMRYHDAPAAIDWLCNTCGFERHLVVPGDDGTITHAQLTCGQGMVMLGSVRPDDNHAILKPPSDLGGVSTQAAYVLVPEVEEHHATAVVAGADIVDPLEPQPYGGKLYSCRDPEGHLWYFGSYDPWSDQ